MIKRAPFREERQRSAVSCQRSVRSKEKSKQLLAFSKLKGKIKTAPLACRHKYRPTGGSKSSTDIVGRALAR